MPTTFITSNIRDILFLLSTGLSFSKMHEQGIDAVVARMEPAVQDTVEVRWSVHIPIRFAQEGLRYVFNQDIFRASDENFVSEVR